jgi:hypothetical protein
VFQHVLGQIFIDQALISGFLDRGAMRFFQERPGIILAQALSESNSHRAAFSFHQGFKFVYRDPERLGDGCLHQVVHYATIYPGAFPSFGGTLKRRFAVEMAAELSSGTTAVSGRILSLCEDHTGSCCEGNHQSCDYRYLPCLHVSVPPSHVFPLGLITYPTI